jgi:ATP-dependent Lhr-like helicase
MPLWLSRLQSQKLLEAVLQLEDFPILLETWRTCLREEFDLESLKRLLAELEAGAIAWTEVRTGRPSPFARSDWWRQVSQYMYRGDEPQSDKTSRLRGDLLQEVVSQPGLRPPVSPDLVRRFELKRQRLSPGYSPQTPRELLDWAVERVMLPWAEWEELLKAMKRDHGLEAGNLMGDLQGKMVRIHPSGAAGPLVLARENLGPALNTFYRGEGTVRVESLEGVLLEPELMEAAFVEEEGEDFSLFLGQWLQFYGPRMVGTIQKILGVKTDPLRLALEDLADSQKVVRGSLVAGGERERFCDRENFETLLRLGRAESRPVIEPREVEWLSLFLATYQGITEPRKNLEGLQDRLEQLLCYPAEAGVWEAEIFPARVRPYDPSWLDTLVQEGDLQWIGSEGHRVAFCFEADLDLLQEDIPRPFSEEPRTEVLLEEFFPDPGGRYDFSALLRHARLTPANLAEKLWNGVWQGRVTNDAFLPLRQAVMNKFKTADPLISQESAARRWGRRRGAQRKQGRFFPGNWHLVARAELPEDLIEAEERRKDRARLLLDRYGILFRELLQRELPALSWSGVFRSLRIMELGGEVFAGYFFKGIPGPQFVSPRALRMLQGELPKDAVYWMKAADPASLCGIQLDSRRGILPPRLSTTHLVYRGMKLTLVSRRTGRDLEFLVPPDDPRLPEYLAFFRHLLGRRCHPVRRIAIERINGEEAPHSPYVPALRNCFEVLLDYRQVNLLGGGTYE